MANQQFHYTFPPENLEAVAKDLVEQGWRLEEALSIIPTTGDYVFGYFSGNQVTGAPRFWSESGQEMAAHNVSILAKAVRLAS